jgi:hypothetical protein
MLVSRRSKLIFIAVMVTVGMSTIFMIYSQLQSIAESDYDENHFHPLYLLYEAMWTKINHYNPFPPIAY